jgi:hypothetical protein
MASIGTPNTELIDRILKEQVEGEKPPLHNACFSAIGTEGEYNCSSKSRV